MVQRNLCPRSHRVSSPRNTYPRLAPHQDRQCRNEQVRDHRSRTQHTTVDEGTLMTPDNSASALTEEDLNELHEEYSDYLIESAPTDWTRIRYTIYSTIDHHAYNSVAITDQSSEIPLFPSPELVELFHTLRTSMFEPGKGTWLAAVYEFDQDG